MKDHGTRWIAEYCDKENIPYPDWLDGRIMSELPRRVDVSVPRDHKDFFKFEVETLEDEDTWSRYIIWIVENLDGRWAVGNHDIWLEDEEDAVAFKLGCI